MKVSRVRWLACLVVPLLTGCVAQVTEAPAAPSLTYTCCQTADIETRYEPGQTFTVHWIVEFPDEPVPASPPQVELKAHLTGPFATEDDLKAAAMGTRSIPGLVTFTAPPVRPSGAPDERPVSNIPIAPDAGPGYYNLVTSVLSAEHTVSGEGIIQVVPRV